MAIAERARDVLETGGQSKNEGRVTTLVERQTAKVPSMVYLNLAFVSIAASITIAASTRKAEWANFVGLWAPAFMLIGIYNKLVKQQQPS